MSSQSTPFFSILMPAHNAEQFIVRAINSVREQDFNNWELIIIDDGSTDNTFEILEKIDDKRIRCYRQEKQGVMKTRLELFSKVRGKYVLHVDSDDLLLHGALTFIYDFLKKNKCDILQFDFRRFHNAEEIQGVEVEKGEVEKEIVGANEIIKGIAFEGKNFLWAKAIKRECLANIDSKKMQMHEIEIGEDLAISIEAAKNAKKMCFISNQLYGYRTNMKSITHSLEGIELNDSIREEVFNTMKTRGALSRKEEKKYIRYCRKCFSWSVILRSLEIEENKRKVVWEKLKRNSYYKNILSRKDIVGAEGFLESIIFYSFQKNIVVIFSVIEIFKKAKSRVKHAK